MEVSKTIDIQTLESLENVAKGLAASIPQGAWVFLEGDLGAGKTTFSKAFIKYRGSNELVTSPTYALMQDYQTSQGVVIHCDLYRLGDPEELFEIGLLDLADECNAVTLVEWAEKGKGVLPAPHYTLKIDFKNPLTQHRTLTVIEHTT